MTLDIPERLRLHPLTPEGRVTVKILRLNDEERVIERIRLIAAGLYGGNIYSQDVTRTESQ